MRRRLAPGVGAGSSPEDQEAALVLRGAGPVFDAVVKRFTAAQIEAGDAKVGALGNEQRLLQSGEQCRTYVIGDSWHLA